MIYTCLRCSLQLAALCLLICLAPLNATSDACPASAQQVIGNFVAYKDAAVPKSLKTLYADFKQLSGDIKKNCATFKPAAGACQANADLSKLPISPSVKACTCAILSVQSEFYQDSAYSALLPQDGSVWQACDAFFVSQLQSKGFAAKGVYDYWKNPYCAKPALPECWD